MSDTATPSPNAEAEQSSNEYGFDPERDPLHKDPAQAKASEYGIYGYADEAGEAFVEQKAGQPPVESEERAQARHEQKAPPQEREQGGQEWDQSEHGAGFAQPMESPQREASQASRPDEAE